jgi:hypothetical protein
MGNHPTFEERVNAFLPEVLRDLQESALLRAEEAKLLGLDPQSKAKAKAKAQAEANAALDAEVNKLLVNVASHSHPCKRRPGSLIGAHKGPSGVRNPANDLKRAWRKYYYGRQYIWQGLDFDELGQLIAKNTSPATIISPEEIARRQAQSAADKAKAKAQAEARAEAKKAKTKTPKRGPKTKANKAKKVSTLPARVPCERVREISLDDLDKRQGQAIAQQRDLLVVREAKRLALKGTTRLLTEEEKKANHKKDAEKNEFYRVNRKEKREFFAFDFTAMVEVSK